MKKWFKRDMKGVVSSISAGLLIYGFCILMTFGMLDTSGWNEVVALIAQVGLPVVSGILGAILVYRSIVDEDFFDALFLHK